MASAAMLGLGKMGSGMARSLLRSGHDVRVWNRSAPAIAPLVEAGARSASSPAEAAAGADAAISMVADDEASERVWLAADGALPALRKGAFAIECSTVSHGHVLRLAEAASRHGAVYLDCPVNGPPAAAAEGKLTLLVGAPKADLEAALPILGAISTSIVHFGPVGAGTSFKLINNLMGAVHIAGLAEAVALSRRLGLDKEALIAAVDGGPCASPHVKRLVRAMVEDRDPDVQGLSIGLREKDARYALAMASDKGAPVPTGEQAYQWYCKAKPALAASDDARLVQTVASGGY